MAQQLLKGRPMRIRAHASLVVIVIALFPVGAVRAEKLAVGAARSFSGEVKLQTRAAALPLLSLRDTRRVTVVLARTSPTTIRSTTTVPNGIAPGRDFVSSQEAEIVRESTNAQGEHTLVAKAKGPGYISDVQSAAAIIAGRRGKNATVLDADAETTFVLRANGDLNMRSDSNTHVQVGGAGFLARLLRVHVVGNVEGELAAMVGPAL